MNPAFYTHIALVLLLSIVPTICRGENWDEKYIESLYKGRILSPIEGVWQFPKDGATIAIVKSHSDTYNIYLIDSPRLDIRPGLMIGTATATPKKNYYDGELNSGKLGKIHKLSSQTVTFTVNDDGALTIQPYKTGYTLSFKRWLSYLFRITVVDNSSKKPNDLYGAKRIYPYIITDHLPICL